MLVTGGGSGLGEAIARRFASTGARIGIIDVSDEGATRVAADLGAERFVGSVTDEPTITAALDQFGAPDVTVCAAGIVRFGALLDLEVEAWREVLEANLTGTFLVAREAARRLVAAERGGSIIAITSINGRAPGLHAGAYGASKAGLGLLVRQMAQEWAPRGIRVNAVAPGLIDAGMSAPIYADAQVRAARESRVPLGRLGSAADVASAVHWLASAEAAYITGQELVVDGGVIDSVMATLPRPASVDGVGTGPVGPLANGRGQG